jgi:hypothetical protein
MTAEQYHAEIMQYLITSRRGDEGSGQHGDEAGDLIEKIIGANALTADETRNVLSIVRAAFSRPEIIPQAARSPQRTILLLQTLADSTTDATLKEQVAETLAWVQTR